MSGGRGDSAPPASPARAAAPALLQDPTVVQTNDTLMQALASGNLMLSQDVLNAAQRRLDEATGDEEYEGQDADD